MEHCNEITVTLRNLLLRPQGGDLRAALTADREGHLGWYRSGKGIALDILRGLHFLHASHVIHRGGPVWLGIFRVALRLCRVYSAGKSVLAMCLRLQAQLGLTQSWCAGTPAHTAGACILAAFSCGLGRCSVLPPSQVREASAR